ncbi:MAG: T9SS type A sorting domain-containing protein [Bacteroidota bacterium]
MKKTFTLYVCLLLTLHYATAQLPNGSVVPDFTATDIEGNTWNLYDILTQGKEVILDVSATWCGPCWTYHNTHVLSDIYNTYGPNGTDEIMVLFIEGDPSTPVDALHGIGGGTLGDWVKDTPYPIIDDADGSIASAFNITYFPTIYHICPNLIINETGQADANTLVAFGDDCQRAFGANNAGIIRYEGFAGTFCQTASILPTTTLQNLGTDNLSSASVDLLLNGQLVETKDWTGDLTTYQLAEVTFSEFSIDQSTEMSFVVTTVNGTTNDEDTSNNQLDISTLLAPDYQENLYTFEILTDEYPTETSWEMRTSDGILLYSIAQGTYTNASTNYQHQVALPSDGCFEFTIFDSANDGICCGYGNGRYRLIDQQNNVIFQGGEFTSSAARPFELAESAGINNNASIRSSIVEPIHFCGDMEYIPQVSVQNIGAQAIETIHFEVMDNSTLVYEMDWQGSIAPYATQTVDLQTLTLSNNAELSIHLTQVNGADDVYTTYNSVDVQFIKAPQTLTNTLQLSLSTDDYGYELYWQLTDDSGDVVASGGNTTVGPDGGGQRVASDTDPGAYGNNTTITETIEVPYSSCYDFLLVDDYGDGLEVGQAVMSDENGAELFRLSGNFGTEAQSRVDVALSVSTDEIEALNQVKLFPNPAKEQSTLSFHLTEKTHLDIGLFNVLGQRIENINTTNFLPGLHNLTINTSKIYPGIYFILLNDGLNKQSMKLIVH